MPSPDPFWEQTTTAWRASLDAWMELSASSQSTWLDAWAGNLAAWQRWQQAALGAMTQPPPLLQGLSGLALANARSSLQALAEAQGDPERMALLWSRLAQAYQRDLVGLPARLAPARAEELARMATELALGQPGPEAQRYLRRFAESLRTKATHGAEVYLEPEQQAVAPTPSELVLEVGGLRLHRYGTEHEPGRPPIVLVYSVINRPWILDLAEGSSLVAHLLERGLDVWMVEWREGTREHADTLDEYVGPWLGQALSTVREQTGRRPVVLGQCIGGTLALIHAALEPESMAGLITLTTPISSTGSSILELWLDARLFPAEALVREHGFVPGKAIRGSIMAIKPYLELLKWKGFYENLHDDQVMAAWGPVDRWANDNPDVAGPLFLGFLDEVYREDRLIRGQSVVAGRKVDLSAVHCPVLNLVASEDWIVPPEGASRISELVGSAEASTEVLPGPHVGIILDPRARPAWDRIADFAVAKADPMEQFSQTAVEES